MGHTNAGYEHYDYVQLDAIADMLEAFGIIWPNEPKVVKGRAPEQTYSYKLPDGTTSGRDNRLLAADAVADHFQHLMFRREEAEAGLSEWQIHHEAGKVNVYDPFQFLRRQLAKAEIYVFCRPKTGWPREWPAILLHLFEGIDGILTLLNRVQKSPHPGGERSGSSTKSLGEHMDTRRQSLDHFVKALVEQTDKSGVPENYQRVTHLLDNLYHVLFSFYQLFYMRGRSS